MGNVSLAHGWLSTCDWGEKGNRVIWNVDQAVAYWNGASGSFRPG